MLNYPISIIPLPSGITFNQACARCKNCLKGCGLLLLKQSYFQILHFAPLRGVLYVSLQKKRLLSLKKQSEQSLYFLHMKGIEVTFDAIMLFTQQVFFLFLLIPSDTRDYYFESNIVCRGYLSPLFK